MLGAAELGFPDRRGLAARPDAGRHFEQRAGRPREKAFGERRARGGSFHRAHDERVHHLDGEAFVEVEQQAALGSHFAQARVRADVGVGAHDRLGRLRILVEVSAVADERVGPDTALVADHRVAADPARRHERRARIDARAGAHPHAGAQLVVEVDHAGIAALERLDLEVIPAPKQAGCGLRARGVGLAGEAVHDDAFGVGGGVALRADFDGPRPQVALVEPAAQEVRAVHGLDGHRGHALANGLVEPVVEERLVAHRPEHER